MPDCPLINTCRSPWRWREDGADITVHYNPIKAAAQETVTQVSAVKQRSELVSADLAGRNISVNAVAWPE